MISTKILVFISCYSSDWPSRFTTSFTGEEDILLNTVED